MRTTFNRLRAVKDSLPHGSMDAIAAELGIPPDGGIVVFSNTRILEVALRRAWEAQNEL